jgi:CheY-like chemotaxis protein
MSATVAANWERSQALMAWSRTLIARSRRLARPIFRGGSDSEDGMLRITDLAGITVLLVDDDQDSVEILALFLGVCGATVRAARSGAEGLAYLDTEPRIDVLVTDCAMPGVDGIELVKAMRTRPKHSAVPAIAVSGYPEKYFESDAERFSAFILKPIDVDVLAATVKRLAASNGASGR